MMSGRSSPRFLAPNDPIPFIWGSGYLQFSIGQALCIDQTGGNRSAGSFNRDPGPAGANGTCFRSSQSNEFCQSAPALCPGDIRSFGCNDANMFPEFRVAVILGRYSASHVSTNNNSQEFWCT